jgi:hypothetical protein
MKSFLAAALALPLVIGWSTSKKTKAHAKPHPALPSSYYGNPRRCSSNPRYDVYSTSGRCRGADPDPMIRDMLRRDDPGNMMGG